jgi:hypothetical protein
MITTDETEDAFTALSDATRIEILRTLWDADDNEATFTELRETVGMRDSGQFNYHLDKLTGRFVRKTDEGYELTIAGQLVYGSILSGAYSGEEAIDPIPLEEPCPACGGNRTISYEDETITVECDSCELTSSTGVPPGVFQSYDREEIPAVADRYFRTIVQQVENGFCWYCEGRVEPTVEPMADGIDDSQEEDWGITDDDQLLPVVKYGCERCGIEVTVNLGNSMLTHPAVISFYYDHGINVEETSIWKFAAWSTDRTCIVGRDPFRARVIYEVGDERLTIDVDDHLQVASIERSDR